MGYYSYGRRRHNFEITKRGIIQHCDYSCNDPYWLCNSWENK